jgi:hypothetical protein
MDKNTELQDKLRVLLALTRECLALKEETDVFESVLYEGFWSYLDAVEGSLSYMKSNCLI